MFDFFLEEACITFRELKKKKKKVVMRPHTPRNKKVGDLKSRSLPEFLTSHLSFFKLYLFHLKCVSCNSKIKNKLEY